MKVSVIIPIYNESAAIESFLAELKKLTGEYEILFADGGCKDDTLAKIGTRYPVIKSAKGRAVQMNTAAKEASGEVLWFLHADSVLPENAIGQIQTAVENGARFGCFHIGFDMGGLFMIWNTYRSNRRAKGGRIAFGDQGIFVTKELFEECGGFPELPIMEDYEFSRRMKKKRIPLHVLPGRIITSGRRYCGRSPLRPAFKMVYLRCLYRAGVDINKISALYRDVR